MTFTLRDLIYVCVYVATVAGLFAGLRFSIGQLKKSVGSIQNIIFKDKGGLNIVDNDKCKEHRDTIHKSIRREAEITHDALTQIHCVNQNIVKIMVHLQLEPIVVKPSEHKQ